MNAMTRRAGTATARRAEFLVGCSLIRLRRDGQTPLRFSGRLIARYDGKLARANLWHDLALYRSANGGYAVEIVALTAPSRPARCHAASVETLDAALTLLETHDAAADICPGISTPALALDDPSVSPAALMLQAAVLQCVCSDVVRRYRIGVGAFLASLGLQDI
jgi:hypothetical protein